MTVAELIEALKDMPQDYEVTFVDTHMQKYRRVKELYIYDEITKEVEIELK